VARRARALRLPCAAERVDGRAAMRQRGLSGEAGLRELRRAFLRRVAREHGAGAIALGHTADDQAETILLRLVRGTGIAGLAAMRARRGPWVRPLLGVTRAQVREFLRDRGARGRVDPSNRDLRWTRNLLRHRVLPVLRRIHPRAVEALAASAESAARSAAVLDALGRRALSRVLARPVPAKGTGGTRSAPRGGGIRLVRTSLLRYHPAIRDNVIRQAWKAAGMRSRGLTRRHLRAVEVLLERGIGGASVHLPLGWRARLERGLLCLLAPESSASGRRAASGRDDA
jgi:tRNA(Ile)-lysidine synthase